MRDAWRRVALLALLLAVEGASAGQQQGGPRRALRQDETSTEASPVTVGGDMGVKGLEQASNQMGIGNPALLQSGGVSLLPAPTAPGAAAWSFPPNEQYGAPPTQQWGGPYVQPLTTAGAQGPAHQWGHPAATSPGGAPPGPGAHPWPAGPGTAGVAHNWGGGGTWGATTVKAPVIVYFLGDLSPPPPPPYPNKAQYFAQNNPTLYRIGTFFGRRLRR